MTRSLHTMKMKLAAGSALLALTLLAMGLKRLQLPLGSTPSPPIGPGAEGLPLPPPWLVLVTAGLFVLAIALLGFWALRTLLRHRRKTLDERVREQPRSGPWAQALALLVTALLLAGLIYGFYSVARITAPELQLIGPPSVGSPPGPPSEETQALPPSSPSAPARPPEAWEALRLSLITLGALAALGWLVLALGPRRRSARSMGELDARQREELAARAGRAAEELVRGGRLGDVVLRCYRDMVAILTQQAEVRMAPEMTAREFAARLRALGLADEPVETLTTLFERVRYGGEALSGTERQQAVLALRALEHRYGRPESAPEERKGKAALTP